MAKDDFWKNGLSHLDKHWSGGTSPDDEYPVLSELGMKYRREHEKTSGIGFSFETAKEGHFYRDAFFSDFKLSAHGATREAIVCQDVIYIAGKKGFER